MHNHYPFSLQLCSPDLITRLDSFKKLLPTMTSRQHRHPSVPPLGISWNTECTCVFIFITHFLFVLSPYFEGCPILEAVFFKTRHPRMQGDQLGNHIYGAPIPRTRHWISIAGNLKTGYMRGQNTTHTHTHCHKDTGTGAQILSVCDVSVLSPQVTAPSTMLDNKIMGVTGWPNF